MGISRKLKYQPLSLVLAEIRFSDKLEIEKDIPQIQEKLRKSFPVYSEEQFQGVQFSSGGWQPLPPKKVWRFASKDKHHAVEIADNRLIYLTSEYDRFPGFLDRCMLAVSVLNEVSQPDLLYRIGLRYNDLVSPRDGEALQEYIHDGCWMASALSDVGGLTQDRSESVFETEVGRLVIRTYVGKINRAVAPDMPPVLPVKIRTDINQGGLSAILDFDHIYSTDPESGDAKDFSPGFIEKKLKELHDPAILAFEKITTDRARNEIWD